MRSNGGAVASLGGTPPSGCGGLGLNVRCRGGISLKILRPMPNAETLASQTPGASRACARSAIRSSVFSMPHDIRIMLSSMPKSFRSSGVQ